MSGFGPASVHWLSGRDAPDESVQFTLRVCAPPWFGQSGVHAEAVQNLAEQNCVLHGTLYGGIVAGEHSELSTALLFASRHCTTRVMVPPSHDALQMLDRKSVV